MVVCLIFYAAALLITVFHNGMAKNGNVNILHILECMLKSLLFIIKKVCIIDINWMLMLELILKYSYAYCKSWCGVILNRAGHHSMENELSRIPGIRTQDVWAMVLRSGKIEFFWLWESPVWASDTVECSP